MVSNNLQSYKHIATCCTRKRSILHSDAPQQVEDMHKSSNFTEELFSSSQKKRKKKEEYTKKKTKGGDCNELLLVQCNNN